MADDPALWARRSRAHRAGDHSMCDPGRCREAAGVRAGDARDERASRDGERHAGGVTAAVTAFVDALAIQPGDTRAPIAATLLRLAEAIDDGRADHMPGLTREFRMQLSWLSEMQAEGDQLDELRARRAQRRVSDLLGAIGGSAS